MIKKIYAQPELTVVTIKRTDILTTSPVGLSSGAQDNDVALSPDRNSWDLY